MNWITGFWIGFFTGSACVGLPMVALVGLWLFVFAEDLKK